MKKKSLLLLASASLLSGFLITNNPVDAATVGSLPSISDVTFTQDTSITSPVNPNDPHTPVAPVNPSDPNDPHSPGTAGPLSIDYISNFHFGSNTIVEEDTVYYAHLDNVLQAGLSIQVPNFVQVTDKTGLNAGWSVTVSQGGQFATTDGNSTPLANAQLQLIQATPNSLVNLSYAPTTYAVALSPTGSSSKIASAPAGYGMGTWTMAFGANNTLGATGVMLNVPMASSKVHDVKYRTSLTWNLANTP